ncbi:MAG: peroxiredoxin [Candidatus Polarisedimenticolia bacterium]
MAIGFIGGFGLAAAVVAAAGVAALAAGAKEAPRGPQVGAPAPDFTLPSDGGGSVTLSALRGHAVVLYFYPKDDTPGCTKEACAFRDATDELKRLGAVVYGVSRDGVESHRKFAAKYKLSFPLLADEGGKVHELYGCFKPKSLYGKTALGVDRSTFLIDKDGVVRRVWRGVDVSKHAAEVRAALEELAAAKS